MYKWRWFLFLNHETNLKYEFVTADVILSMKNSILNIIIDINKIKMTIMKSLKRLSKHSSLNKIKINKKTKDK